MSGRPIQTPGLVLFQDAARAILSDLKGRERAVLNPTAAALWELCDGSTTPDEMVRAVCQLFRATPAEVESDVLATLEQLAAAGLISWGGVEAGPHVGEARRLPPQ